MEERRKILEMVRDGLISVEEAEQLLDAFAGGDGCETEKCRDKILIAKAKIEEAVKKLDESLARFGGEDGRDGGKIAAGSCGKIKKYHKGGS